MIEKSIYVSTYTFPLTFAFLILDINGKVNIFLEHFTSSYNIL